MIPQAQPGMLSAEEALAMYQAVSTGPGVGLEDILLVYTQRVLGVSPVNRGVAELLRDLGATLEARQENPGLRWRELLQGFWQEWYCEPPAPGSRYRTVREDWADGTAEHEIPVRRIYEIARMADAAEESPSAAGTGAVRAGPAGPGPAPAAGASPAAAPGTETQGTGGTGGHPRPGPVPR